VKPGAFLARVVRLIADELDSIRAAAVIRETNAQARHDDQMAKLDAILAHLPPLVRRVELVEEDVETLKKARHSSLNGNGKGAHV
jgi:hypothetical protein